MWWERSFEHNTRRGSTQILKARRALSGKSSVWRLSKAQRSNSNLRSSIGNCLSLGGLSLIRPEGRLGEGVERGSARTKQ